MQRQGRDDEQQDTHQEDSGQPLQMAILEGTGIGKAGRPLFSKGMGVHESAEHTQTEERQEESLRADAGQNLPGAHDPAFTKGVPGLDHQGADRPMQRSIHGGAQRIGAGIEAIDEPC